MPFVALQKRLGRKSPSAAIRAQVPVIFVAFDVLAHGPRGREVEAGLDQPLAERRRRLDTLALPLVDDGGAFALSHLESVDSVEDLERAFADARGRNNEGLMVRRSIRVPIHHGLCGLGFRLSER